jgi:hypothetical protein
MSIDQCMGCMHRTKHHGQGAQRVGGSWSTKLLVDTKLCRTLPGPHARFWLPFVYTAPTEVRFPEECARRHSHEHRRKVPNPWMARSEGWSYFQNAKYFRILWVYFTGASVFWHPLLAGSRHDTKSRKCNNSKELLQRH